MAQSQLDQTSSTEANSRENWNPEYSEQGSQAAGRHGFDDGGRSRSGKRHPKRFAKISLSAILLIGTGLGGYSLVGNQFSGESIDTSNLVTETVKKGPFRITVSERGELDSLKSATISSGVEGTTTIIFIVPEGTQVKEGQLVCELDSSTLVDKHKEQQIKLTQSIADLEKAKKNVQIQEEQNTSDIAAVKLQIRLAELDLKKFEDGEKSQQENEKRGELQLAKEELIRAQDAYEFSKRIAKKGYETQQELEAKRIAVKKAEFDHAKAEEALDVLTKYEFERTVVELREKVAEAKREMKRVNLQGEASLEQFKAELNARELSNDVETEKTTKLDTQIKACKLYAPQAGEVVYPSQRSRRSEAQVIEEGATVRQLQEILKLPDLSQMKVDAKIHESRIGLVSKGMPVIVRIDAVPGEIYRGVVDFISSVPLSPEWRTPDLRQYSAVVRLTDDGERISRLRPGLTANIEIVAEQREDVLQVPVQTIVTVSAKRFAFAITDEDEVQRREVLIGQSSNKTIEILDGLAEGEKVVMNPRTVFADQLADLAAELGVASTEDVKIEAEATGSENEKSQSNKQGKKQGRAERTKGDAKQGRGTNGGPGRGEDRKKRRPDSAAMIKQYDKNGDGKLSKDEVPSQMQPFFGMVDANKDGFADQAELKKIGEKMRQRGGGRGGRGGGPPR